MRHPYIGNQDAETPPVILALNDYDAEEFRLHNPTLADARWLTPSQYLRLGAKAPRQTYTTDSVKELPSYPSFVVAVCELFETPN